MAISVEQLMEKIENKWMVPLKAEIEAIGAAAEKANVEEKEALVERGKALDARMAEYDEALKKLAEVKERKDMPAAEKEANKPHKFTGLRHFAYDLWKAGEGCSNPSDDLREWNNYCEEFGATARDAGTPSQNVGELEAGGALVPTEYAATLLERISDRLDLMQSATIMPMAVPKINVPFLDGFDESQCEIAGGCVAYWKGEEKQYVATQWEVGVVALNLNKLTGLSFMTDELLKWSAISVEPILYRTFEQAFIKAMTRGIIRGTGVDMPLGILNAPGTLTVDKQDGQDPDTVILNNILQMYAQFYGDVGDGTWYCNRMLLPDLCRLNQEVGTGGSNVFLMNQQVQNRLVWVLLGMPLIFCDQMSAIGDLGDIGLFNMAEYLIGQPTGQVGPDVAQSIHLKFDYGQTAFRFTAYYDGQPWAPEVYIPPFGDNRSPFVILEAR